MLNCTRTRRNQFFIWVMSLSCLVSYSVNAEAQAVSNGAALQRPLEMSYLKWRQAMVAKNAGAWQATTARHRQVMIRNRILSEKRSFPAAIFEIPAAPPTLKGLRPLQIKARGLTAKAVYFGKVDFGVGGKPTDNLLVISYVKEGAIWKYDSAEFLNLFAIPDVVKQLQAGNLAYLKGKPEFDPTGVIPKATTVLTKPVAYIAKVYVFCPGREVKVLVNGKSRHSFNNNKEAELVIGGARNGLNEIQFTTRTVVGAKGTDPLAIRVYLMSQNNGTKPIKAYEYLVNEGQPVKPVLTEQFQVTPAIGRKILGR